MKFSHSSLIAEEKIAEAVGNLAFYIKNLKSVAEARNYDFDESSINLPFDGELLEKIKKIKKEKVSRDLKYIVLIGIGGSNLGAKAIYDAIFGCFDILEPRRFPKMIFLDAIDPEFNAKFKIFLKNEVKKTEEILIVIVSKSGETLETKINDELVANVFSKHFGKKAEDRFVVITDFKSKLWRETEEKKSAVLEIPKRVGGRYSIFSSAGLFPLAVCGVDIKKLQDGAKETLKEYDSPALSAAIIFLNYQAGKTINDNFFFHPEMESLGKWTRQLMAESLGKDEKGITPTVSIGTTDLHGVFQLNISGPKNKFTTFIRSEKSKGDKKSAEAMKTVFESVKIAYNKNKLPFSEIVLDDVSENSLGRLTQFKMIETMFLAKFFEVNAFNQPSVEEYKKFV